MKMISKINEYIKNPLRVVDFLGAHGRLKWMPDEKYLKLLYKSRMNKVLDLDNPQTFNEKLQWLKLNDRKTIYTTMVDKYEVKKYVASIIGEKYIIPTIGVWERFDDIDFSTFPNQFILKCTHDSGSLVICKDKNQFDVEAALKKINAYLKSNYYWAGREWPYKDVKPRIIAEQYMNDGGKELSDYKVHNFNGVPKVILTCCNRFTDAGLTQDFFSAEWEHLNIKRPDHPNAEEPIACPKKLREMLDISERLAQNIPFLRTDFYAVNDKLYFGELTLHPASGLAGFVPEDWDTTLGSWLKLSGKV